MKRGWLIAVAVACIIGSVFALVSTSQFFRIQEKGFEQKSYCSISEVIDCDVSTASSYSTFMDVPVAWMGFLMYLTIGVFAAFSAISKKPRKATLTVAWGLAIFSVIYSIRMGYILFHILQVVCIDCISMYVINLFILLVLWKVMGVGILKLPGFIKSYVLAVLNRPSHLGFAPKIISHLVVVILIFGVGWLSMYKKVLASQDEQQMSIKDKIKAHYVQSLYDINIDKNWPEWGNPDAKVTVIEYSEFECPFCRLSAFTFRPYLNEFKKDIKYYFVNYPLDNQCNPYLNYPMHPKACMAAKAGICAKEQGDFWAFHDEMFRMKKNLNEANILKLAKEENLDIKKFEQCMASEETQKQILSEIENGKRIHLTGVPAIFINGRKIKYWRDPQFIQELIKEEIKRSKEEPR